MIGVRRRHCVDCWAVLGSSETTCPIRTLGACCGGRQPGLEWIQDDVPAIAELLDDADLDVRSRARAALAELGGRRAADALFATVQGLDDDERGEVQGALAWLGDDRDLVATRRIAFEHFTDVPDDGWVPESGAWAAVAALIRIGDDHDRQILCDVAYEDVDRQLEQEPESEAIDEGEGEVPSYKIMLPGRASRPVHLSVVYHLGWNLRRAGFGKDSDRLIERLRAHDRADEIGSFTGRQRGVVCEPFEPRTVPRLAFGGLRLGPVASTRGPAAKFGGQPDWLSEPEWPLDPDGDPMVFVAQFPLLGSERAHTCFSGQAPTGVSGSRKSRCSISAGIGSTPTIGTGLGAASRPLTR